MLRRLPRLVLISALCVLLAACTQTDPPPTTAPEPERTEANLDEIEEKASDNPCGNLNELIERVRRGYYSFLSPDIQPIPREPNYIGSAAMPVHSGPWDYLTHVPLVAYGPGHFVAGEYSEEATMADLAPTTAALVGYDEWPKRDGRVLEEALDPSATEPPKLVVSMVWDGGGWNTLEAHEGEWPHLERLIDKSASFTNFNVGSSPSVTPPIHTTLGTGSFPSRHGIVGLKVRAEDYSQVNPFVDLDGDALKVTTLADEYDRDNGNKPVTGMFGSVSWHLGMIGHGAALEGGDHDPVALLDKVTAEVKTNTAVYSQPSIDDLSQLDRAIERLDAKDGTRDQKWRGHPLETPDDVHLTPAIVDYEQWLLERMIETERFGADKVPDLLYVNFKTSDITGHKFGMTSPEVGAAIRAQDANLRRLVRFLDRTVGKNEWVLMLTADHGQTPYPEESGAWPIYGGELARDLNAVFDKTDDDIPLIRSVGSAGVYVQLDQLDENNAKLWKIARWITGYTVKENIKDGTEPPPGFEGRKDDLLFDAVLSKRRVAGVACGKD